MMKYSLPFPLPQSLRLVDKLRGYKTGFTADEWRAHTLYILPEGMFWVCLVSVVLWLALRLIVDRVKPTPPRYLTWLNYKAATIYFSRFAIVAGL